MKLTAYTRVSTGQQVEAYGLTIQRQAIEASGHEIVEWFSDAGISGKEGLARRAGLADALDHVRKTDGLIVARLDRLARDLVLQEQLLAEVRRVGKVVISCAEGENAYLQDNPDDPSRSLIRQILGAVAEYERAMIRLRTWRGRRAKRAKDGWAGGACPYGYRIVGKKLVPDEGVRGAALRQILRWRRKGWSQRKILQACVDAGFPPPQSNTWHLITLQRILQRAKDKRQL